MLDRFVSSSRGCYLDHIRLHLVFTLTYDNVPLFFVDVVDMHFGKIIRREKKNLMLFSLILRNLSVKKSRSDIERIASLSPTPIVARNTIVSRFVRVCYKSAR